MDETKKKKAAETVDVSKLTYDDIEAWILLNRKDMDLMDDINKLTYPYTQKYQDQVARGR